MKFTIFFTLFCAFLGNCGYSHESNNDENIWGTAFYGDFSLAHKQMLNRPQDTLNDVILNQFIMAYVQHRMGNDKEVLKTFQNIDCYLEFYFQNKDR